MSSNTSELDGTSTTAATAASAAAPRITARARAKAERRTEIIDAATRLMARNGFRGVRLDDIGAAVGVSGPAMYRHFSSKEDLLLEMLTDISERLLAAGYEVMESTDDPEECLDGLIAVHVEFAITEPDLISVQYRDMDVLGDTERRRVRVLQRRYVELWADALLDVSENVDETSARVRVAAAFGLLNSSPRFPRAPRDHLRSLLTAMVRAALLAEDG